MVIFTFLSALSSLSSVSARTLTDDLGRKVRVVASPRRMVSLSPSVTEILFAVGAGDRVVADTEHCTYPPAALTLPKIGGSMTPNVEQIVAMKSDLVIGDTATTLAKERVTLMERAGLNVAILQMRSVADVVDRIGKVGIWCGLSKEAGRLAGQFRKRLEAVRRSVKGRRSPKVLFVVWAEPLWTVGRPTYVSDAVRMAGGRNVSDDIENQNATFSLEEVVKRDPDVIILAFHQASSNSLPPVWNQLRAVKEGRCVVVDPDVMVRAGPRLIDGIEALADILHPDRQKPGGR